jgi:predicted hydrocarbon binding protein
VPPTMEDLMARGKMAATSGQKDLAREYLARVVQQDPRNEEAWLWLSGVANTLPMMRGCLERVLAINPNNGQAREGIAWVQQREAQMQAAQAAQHAVSGNGAPAAHRPVSETFSAEEEGEHEEEPILAPPTVEGQEPMYASAAMHVLLHAVEKVTGEKGVNAILRNAGLERYINNYPPNEFIYDIPYSTYSAFCRSMEEFYGRAAKAMQLRVGQELFAYGLNEQPRLLGVAATAMKFMPLAMKMKFVLDKVARTTRETAGVPVENVDEGDHFTFIVRVCPYCYGRHTDIGCNAMVGVFTATLRWATGKTFPAEEVTCRGKGDSTCSYRIGKQPID